MKYKIGDKVRIRTWDDLKEEFGMNSCDWIATPMYSFQQEKEEAIIALDPDRVLTDLVKSL